MFAVADWVTGIPVKFLVGRSSYYNSGLMYLYSKLFDKVHYVSALFVVVLQYFDYTKYIV